MFQYIIKRLMQSLLTLLLLSFVCYFVLTLMPGDPVDMMAAGNPNITSEDMQRLKSLYGLDQPAYKRYLNWMGTLLSGDLGFSRTYKIPVSDILGPRILNTFYLSVFALVLSLLVAVPLGVYAAVHKGKLTDYLLNLFAFAGISIPSFWLALILILMFAVKAGLLPAGGTYSVGQDLEGFALVWDRIKYLILPVLSLSFMQIGTFERYTRGAMLEILNSDYIRTARSKGLEEKKVLFKHAFRNALIPLITVVAISFSYIFSGAIITETVFAYQGVGKSVYDSIKSNDFNVAMVSFMISMIMVFMMSLLADIFYAVVDPRIKY
ncbi:MAG: ABC transporter permease [Bdellovibrionales bacterium]|nr:ABC transporter permease [Bdellovibrionales bacterium]